MIIRDTLVSHPFECIVDVLKVVEAEVFVKHR